MVDMIAETLAVEADEQKRQIAARIERLPSTSWHTRMRLIVGTAWFFDSFDSYAIAYVMPTLITLWSLEPSQIGPILAAGAFGQMFGAIAFGRLAERIGRVPVMIITILIITTMSFAAAFTWNSTSLMIVRFVQGLGIGGEIPVMYAYLNEWATSKRRGRFTLSINLLFTIGTSSVALVSIWVVPHLGWQALFLIGAVPALLTIPLRRILPESPRWSSSQGHFDDADRVLRTQEDRAVAEGKTLPPLPINLPLAPSPKARFAELFSGRYRTRTLTVWAIYFSTFFVSYGFQVWLPSIYRVVFQVPVDQALRYGFINTLGNFCGSVVCVLAVDQIGRKTVFLTSLTFAALALFVLAAIPERPLEYVVVLGTLSGFFISSCSLSIGMYSAENYPTHLRALGTGVAGSWARIASLVGPIIVGSILPVFGLSFVFAMFGCVAILGALVCLLFAVETRGRVLEEVSPVDCAATEIPLTVSR